MKPVRIICSSIPGKFNRSHNLGLGQCFSRAPRKTLTNFDPRIVSCTGILFPPSNPIQLDFFFKPVYCKPKKFYKLIGHAFLLRLKYSVFTSHGKALTGPRILLDPFYWTH